MNKDLKLGEYSTTLLYNSKEQFVEEMQLVEEKLAQAFDGLYSPLSFLVRSQTLQAKPHLRAAVVLAAATSTQPIVDLKQKRISLAAALEMLYIALNVHQLLLTNQAVQNDDTIDKSILGSTILAGDYCFSHAASLAAATDHQQVVAIFSQTLQNISEKQLRSLFANHSMSKPFNASVDLLRAGIQSSALLAQFNSAWLESYEQLVERLDAQILYKEMRSVVQHLPLPIEHKARWQALIDWLNEDPN